MKRLIPVGLFVNVVLLAGILGVLLKMEVVVHAVGGGVVPAGNGDVNGDGKLDLTDAMYLLSHLFQGGPAPVAIECPQLLPRGLPPTGQTKCYDDAGNEIACDSPDFPGQDGFYQADCPNAGRFVDNGDGTVTDNCTGLMWQKDTADTNGIGNTLPWCDAIAYCDNLSFAGHEDWRLPNVRELQSIVDYGRFNPSIGPVFGAFSFSYWSSTSFASFPRAAWLVSFDGGFVNDDEAGQGGNKSSPGFVRAVRNAP
jgi:hypothetical protein